MIILDVELSYTNHALINSLRVHTNTESRGNLHQLHPRELI